MEQGDGLVADFEAPGFFEAADPGAATVIVPDQEIAVAADEINAGAAGGQGLEGFRNFITQRSGCIVPDPDFEQIAQDVERPGFGRRSGQEVPEQPDGFGPPGVQVEIGDQIDGCA